MKCLIDKTPQKPFLVFPKRALFNKPIKEPLENATAEMNVCYNPKTGHISSKLETEFEISDLLERIYAQIYKSYAPAGLSGFQKRYTKYVSDWLIKVLPKKSKILEIGCHDGFLLNELRSVGHQCVGVEPSPSANYAIETYKLDVRNQFFSDGIFEDEEFDVIIMRHVVEHVPDPVKFVKSAVKSLKKGGIAYIEVPNSQWCVENCYFPEFHVDHISYFTMNSFIRLLEMTGLSKILHIESFNAYMRFPFLMALVNKAEHSYVAPNSYFGDKGFLNFSINESIKNFSNKFDVYMKALNRLKNLGSLAVWGSGSIGTQYAIDGSLSIKDSIYVDPNLISQGLKLSVTGHLVNHPDVLLDFKPENILIASGWEKDVSKQVLPYVSKKTKVFTFSDLISGTI
jgi:2-polyprenyl-3-methyl-5-hydroxy-6-metoxy-1,4-benzoquinol methylase